MLLEVFQIKFLETGIMRQERCNKSAGCQDTQFSYYNYFHPKFQKLAKTLHLFIYFLAKTFIYLNSMCSFLSQQEATNFNLSFSHVNKVDRVFGKVTIEKIDKRTHNKKMFSYLLLRSFENVEKLLPLSKTLLRIHNGPTNLFDLTT